MWTTKGPTYSAELQLATWTPEFAPSAYKLWKACQVETGVRVPPRWKNSPFCVDVFKSHQLKQCNINFFKAQLLKSLFKKQSFLKRLKYNKIENHKILSVFISLGKKEYKEASTTIYFSFEKEPASQLFVQFYLQQQRIGPNSM